jgi:chromosome segregation ATPase
MHIDDTDDASDETPSDETVSVDESETPSDADEPSDDDAPAEDDAETDDETPSSTAKADGDDDEPEELKKALSKHKGSKAALAKHYWQTQSQNARMAARIKELEESAASPRTPAKTEPEPADEVPASLKEIDDEIGALKAERDAIPEQFQALRTEYDAAKRDVTKLELQLERADDMDKGPLQAELRAAKSDVRRIESEAKGLKRDAERLGKDIAAKDRERKVAEREAQTERARQQQQKADTDKVLKEFPKQVAATTDATYKVTADKFKLPVDKDTQSDVRAIANDMLATWFQRNRMAGRQHIPTEDTEKQIGVITARIGRLMDRAAKNALLAASKPRTPGSAARPASPGRPASPAAPSRDRNPPAFDDGRTPGMRAARERLMARLGTA